MLSDEFNSLLDNGWNVGTIISFNSEKKKDICIPEQDFMPKNCFVKDTKTTYDDECNNSLPHPQ